MRTISKTKVSVMENGDLRHTELRITIDGKTITLFTDFADARDVAIANMINHELRLIGEEDINIQELENIKSFESEEITEEFVPVVVPPNDFGGSPSSIYHDYSK
jgi:hypothetical protein